MILRVLDLGLSDYLKAYQIQRNILNDIKLKNSADSIIFCQHPCVITLGRKALRENILISQDKLEAEKIKVCEVDRGGDITLHNPGQLVVYPIFNLHRFKMDLRWFMDKLESIVIKALTKINIFARSKEGFRGAWVNNNKIASIGIGVRSWISYHGLALNVCNDLNNFSYIRPCGLSVEMTSIAECCNQEININNIQKILLDEFMCSFLFDKVKEDYICQN